MNRRAHFAASILANPYIPQDPTVKQVHGILCDEDEILFGGAAGGGKSSWLLMGALQYIEEPGYSALILRRTYKDLYKPDCLIPRSHEWLTQTDAKWNDQKKEWSFPSGATLSFGHMEYEKDKYTYQGAAYHYIGFDELTQFSEGQYSYLFSRLRKLQEDNIPLRVRSASNPGGIGHDWVKARFLLPGEADTRLESHMLAGGQDVTVSSRFIPSRLEDNRHLNQTEYERSLLLMNDDILYHQLRHGDWDIVVQGTVFKRDWFNDKILECLPSMLDEATGLQVEIPLTRLRFWDMAATKAKSGHDPDWTVGLKMGEYEGNYYVLDVVRVQEDPAEVDQTLRETTIKDGRDCIFRMEQEPGASGKIAIDHYSRGAFQGYDFFGVPSTGDKATRARPVASACRRGNVYLINGPWVTQFLNELASFPGGVHDDDVDGLSGSFTAINEEVGGLGFGSL